jgi:hypothetical protein
VHFLLTIFIIVLSLLLPCIIILFLHLLSTNHKCTQACYFPCYSNDAIYSVGGGVLFVAEGIRLAEFVVAARGLLLLLDVQGATRLGEGDDGVVRTLLHCHELVLPAEKIVFALVLRRCTSLSALQAK